ncbi:MAG: hypothetical protein MR762_05330 [Clostridiales bacterium]|nr:hypothetical protein [Clostridiales bacterium]
MQTMVPLYGFGGGSGGTGAKLTVNAPAGATVTVSKDGKSKTKAADFTGVAVFKGLATGDWTVTITDGTQTAQKAVTITADYSTAITFFSATIHVTYPAGSTCTATDGATTLQAPDTSGTWDCVVPNAGAWTVCCTSVADSDSKAVEIATEGMEVNIELVYGILFLDGDEYVSRTGGWKAKDNGGYTGTLTNNGTSLSLVGSGTGASAIAGIKNTSLLNLSDYSAVVIKVTASSGTCAFGILKTYDFSDFSTVWAAKKAISGVGEFRLDISGVSSGVPLIQVLGGKLTFSEFRLVR